MDLISAQHPSFSPLKIQSLPFVSSHSFSTKLTVMSSIVTAVPSGPIQTWCVKQPWIDPQNEIRDQCANATQGTTDSDFETICCDGSIVDTAKNLFDGGPVDLADLVCCQPQGPQSGGLQPLPTNAPTECSTGTPIPLASLAATNTDNAQDFLVTYTSASFGYSTTGDFIPTQIPYCLWAYTVSGVSLTNITVPVAQITTLSSSSYIFDTVSSVTEDASSKQSTSPTKSTSRTGSSTAGVVAQSSSTGSRATFKKLYILGLLCAAAVALQ